MFNIKLYILLYIIQYIELLHYINKRNFIL